MVEEVAAAMVKLQEEIGGLREQLNMAGNEIAGLKNDNIELNTRLQRATSGGAGDGSDEQHLQRAMQHVSKDMVPDVYDGHTKNKFTELAENIALYMTVFDENALAIFADWVANEKEVIDD